MALKKKPWACLVILVQQLTTSWIEIGFGVLVWLSTIACWIILNLLHPWIVSTPLLDPILSQASIWRRFMCHRTSTLMRFQSPPANHASAPQILGRTSNANARVMRNLRDPDQLLDLRLGRLQGQLPGLLLPSRRRTR